VTYDTTLGAVALIRETARCSCCKSGVEYLDDFLQITPQGMTPALSSAVALAGTCEAFEQASNLLKATLHRDIDDNRVQKTVGYVAQLASGWVTLGEETLEEVLAEMALAEPLTVYVGVDGGRIRFIDEGWKEPCEGVIWWKDPVTGEGKRIVLGDARDKAKVLGALDRFLTLARERCPQVTVIIIADGAEWIWRWAEKHEQAVKILDYYHLKEHLYEAGRALYGEDSLRVKQWVKPLENLLWEGEVAQTVARLEEMRPQGTAQEKSHKQEGLKDLATYLENHEGLIAYSEHREQGRTIGSGTAESTCKQLFNMRLKGPGMFWSVPGAQAVIHLRCVNPSRRWDQLWQPPQHQEQELALAA
jgi:hypothetical protein